MGRAPVLERDKESLKQPGPGEKHQNHEGGARVSSEAGGRGLHGDGEGTLGMGRTCGNREGGQVTDVR